MLNSTGEVCSMLEPIHCWGTPKLCFAWGMHGSRAQGNSNAPSSLSRHAVSHLQHHHPPYGSRTCPNPQWLNNVAQHNSYLFDGSCSRTQLLKFLVDTPVGNEGFSTYIRKFNCPQVPRARHLWTKICFEQSRCLAQGTC